MHGRALTWGRMLRIVLIQLQPWDPGQGTACLTLTLLTWPRGVTWGSGMASRAPPWALPGDRPVADGGWRGASGARRGPLPHGSTL